VSEPSGHKGDAPCTANLAASGKDDENGTQPFLAIVFIDWEENRRRQL
jgi:hypothetical protein